MARRLDLIDQFTELVVGADDPRRLAERTLEVVMSLLNGRAGAVFTRDGEGVTLFASRGIDQAVLEIVRASWESQKDAFRAGETFYVPDRATERRLPAPLSERSGPASFAIVPVLEDETAPGPPLRGQPGAALLRRPRSRPALQVLPHRRQVGQRHRLARARWGGR